MEVHDLNNGIAIHRKLVVVERMKKIPFGIMFFDDESTVYISKTIHDRMLNKEISDFDFVLLGYRTTQTDIDSVINQIEAALKTSSSTYPPLT